ncbi:MAG: hypothetical protein ACYC8V_13035 [Caulobacteraceae bacterium]
MENDIAKNNDAEFDRRLAADTRTFARRALLGGLALATSAGASVANGQSMFARAPDTSAALAVEIVGLAIVLFTGLCSLGMLVAGVWITLHRRAEARASRR